MPFDALEKAINEVSDKDWNWWPFLWLRPAKDARLSVLRIAALALLYGLPCGAFASVSHALVDPTARAKAPIELAAFPLLFLFIAAVVVAPMWNRRAARVARAAQMRSREE